MYHTSFLRLVTIRDPQDVGVQGTKGTSCIPSLQSGQAWCTHLVHALGLQHTLSLQHSLLGSSHRLKEYLSSLENVSLSSDVSLFTDVFVAYAS